MPTTRPSPARQVQAPNRTHDEGQAAPAKRQRRRRRRQIGWDSSDPRLAVAESSALIPETQDEDDTCAICRLLLYRPVRTTCNHVFCESCIAEWAEVTNTGPLSYRDLDEPEVPLPVHLIEAKCPMCRSHMSASLDELLSEKLARQYPRLHANRATEEAFHDFAHDKAQILTVYVGCEYQALSGKAARKHPERFNYSTFLRPSRTDIIEGVQFRLCYPILGKRVGSGRPPYGVTGIGRGILRLCATIILKPGYSWLSRNGGSHKGAHKCALNLKWTLKFPRPGQGRGRKGRIGFRVRSDKGWDTADGQVDKDEARGQRTTASCVKDGNVESPADEV